MRGRSFGLLIAVALVAAACGGGGGGGEKEGGTIQFNGRTANNHGSADVGGQTSEDIEVDSFYFDPTVLKGSGGQKITLELENESDTTHNFSLNEQSIDQDVSPGQKVEVDVTFPASGQLVFFCKFHESSGMIGALQAG